MFMAPKDAVKHTKEIVTTFDNFFEEGKKAPLLSEVAQELQNVAASAHKDHQIKVTSAVKLEEDEKKRLQLFFKSVLNRQYPLINIVSSQILGGLKVEWGDFMLDMSLRSRLTQLRQRLQ